MATGEDKEHFPSFCLNLVVIEDDGCYSSGNRTSSIHRQNNDKAVSTHTVITVA